MKVKVDHFQLHLQMFHSSYTTAISQQLLFFYIILYSLYVFIMTVNAQKVG